MTAFELLGLGFVLGLRHAVDPDHLAAVGTIVSREQSLRGALRVGALWGLGHTATVPVVGGALVAFGVSLPPRLGLSLELVVALMLIALGAAGLRSAKPPPHHPPARLRDGGLRSLVVGLVHGLAGSTAMALLVASTVESAAAGIAYLGVLSLGTLAGMVALSVSFAAPLRASSRKWRAVPAAVARLAGAASVCLGLFLVYEVAVVGRLFGAAPVWSPR